MFTTAVYYPALEGRFLLDDFSSLDNLSDINEMGYANFILGGSAGPSGRPVSLLTFALQHEAWPRDPFAFKLVNLIIHLLNGVLVYLLSFSLFTYTGQNRNYQAPFALLTSFLWLIQPIQISAVLYAVQRMTLLSAFFSLAGILAYLQLWGSDDAPAQKPRWVLWTFVFSGCLLLSVFSKESGVLLPVHILVIEFALLQGIRRPKVWKAWARIFLYLPIACVLIYLAFRFDNVMAAYQARSYSMLERLLTESRILFDYLYNIIFPHPSAFGLYHDAYPVSRGLFSPPSTFIAVAGIAVLSLIAVLGRWRLPVLSFSILWYFASHLLESTYINLELYFEHRNYLAVYGICFLIASLAIKIHERMRKKFIAIALILAVVTSAVYVTCMELDLWSKPIEQALEWQRRSPGSLRAREDIGNLYIVIGDGEKALEVYREMRTAFPDDVYPYMKVINIKGCLQKTEISDGDWKAVLMKAQEAKWYGLSPIAELNALVDNLQKGKCKNVDLFLLIRMILTLAYNPNYAHHRDMLHELAAILNMYMGETEAALNNINQALLQKQTISRHFLKTRILLDQNSTLEARQALDEIRRLFKRHPGLSLAYRKPMEFLERRLAGMETGTGPAGPNP